jgi:hypothetical protein
MAQVLNVDSEVMMFGFQDDVLISDVRRFLSILKVW